VVGRGGIELHLRSIETVEPAVAELIGLGWSAPLPAGSPALVVVAEPPGAPGAPVGVAVGRASADGAVLERVVVSPAHRRRGIARQLVTQWCRAATDRGAGVVVGVRDEQDAEVAAVADALGFVAVQRDLWVRRVGPLPALGALGSPP
jgi:GNAT superfamily N-acetyltransferase